ncbi:MAG: sigma-54 interaction domain-containing protein [Planctomycetota bacterium]
MENKIVIKSKIMQLLYDNAKLFAQSDEPVLILGESGVGKEVLAKFIHNNSKRCDKPFLAINCASLPENLIESELFGYKKGAFTDAKNDKIGLLKGVMGGTVFLDEIADIPMSLQAKLLRALETKEIMPLGSTHPEKVNFRLISATNKEPIHEVQKNRFRDDLYYRISTFILRIPPLRERTEEIPYFVDLFLQELKPGSYLSPEALELFLCYPWPGNIRELKNAIIYSSHLSSKEKIDIDCLPDWLKNFCAKLNLLPRVSIKERVRCFEKQLIEYYKKCNNVDIKMLAEQLGISIASLYRKLSQKNSK